jgi:protein-disulfide isomerase
LPDSNQAAGREDPGMAKMQTRSRALVLAVGAALFVGITLIGASRLAAEPESPAKQAAPPASAQLLEEIPQEGTVLGRPDAPVTLVEYADLQCPYCAQWALGTFPALVRDYVRQGKLRIEFRGLAFIGPDSETALRAALAAGRQDRLWNVVERLYANQGAENSGWASEELIDRIAESVPGLDADRFDADRGLAALTTEMAKSQRQAQAGGVRGTPSFELGLTGSELETLELTSLAPDEFAAAIAALLAR